MVPCEVPSPLQVVTGAQRRADAGGQVAPVCLVRVLEGLGAVVTEPGKNLECFVKKGDASGL